MMNGVFPFIKNLHPDGESAYSKYMGDAIFKIPTPALLTKVIDGIDGLNLEGDSKEIYMNTCCLNWKVQERTDNSEHQDISFR